MSTARQRRAARGKASLDKRIERVLEDRLNHYLSDISFRISQAYDVESRADGAGRKVYAEDLNLPGRAFLTGYVVTNNSPTAGSIAWADVHMVYNGTDTLITNGSTANMYVWWSPITTPTVLQTSNTKPVLANGEVLLFQNIAGTHKVMLSDTNASLPNVLANGSVDTGAIIAKAVTTTALNDNAVTSGQLANNAVIAGKINAGAINASTAFTTGVVNSAALGPDSVISGKVADGAIDHSAIFTTGVVNAAAVGTGAVGPTKLNILRHVLY